MEYIEHTTIKRTILYYFAVWLEQLCTKTHFLALIEIKLTKRHCNLSLLSLWLDDKYNLGVWKKRQYRYLIDKDRYEK